MHPDERFVLLFGGVGYSQKKILRYNDLWALKLENMEWSNIHWNANIPPRGRLGHTANFSAQGSVFVVIGGMQAPQDDTLDDSELYLGDISVYDVEAKWWSVEVQTVMPRWGHATVTVEERCCEFSSFRNAWVDADPRSWLVVLLGDIFLKR